MNFLHALLLGIVEGITEFLPVSSTGHLILASKLLGQSQTEFLKSFEISIQLGAMLAVVALYWRKLFLNLETAKHILAAFIPTAVLGFIFYPAIKKSLLGNDSVVLWSLFLGGIFIIIFERLYKSKSNENISYRQAFVIGLFQSLAMVPGVSRSAATIIGGLMLGVKRQTAVEFSFLLAVPTLLAASGLDLVKNASSFSSDQFIFLGSGFVTSFVAAFLGIRFFLRFIQTHDLTFFGIYRIALALVFWGWVR